ncbi:protein FAM177A1-like [Achroia grisella]|uniref:protein FAM177A1-like n=1 Tax=Achroia grisella TaxID=688607 RepID=UPI0027D264C9|nr:protein FAM177A1-like [Achroia grisella]
MENSEEINTNTHVEVTINKPSKVIYFSDGVEEVIDEVTVSDLNSTSSEEEAVDPKQLDWGPWFSHYAWKSGTKVLKAVDYAGESLADFFGITSPKYQIEVNEYERIKEEKRKLDEQSAGWVPKNAGGDVPLVMQEPVRDVHKPTTS